MLYFPYAIKETSKTSSARKQLCLDSARHFKYYIITFSIQMLYTTFKRILFEKNESNWNANIVIKRVILHFKY